MELPELLGEGGALGGRAVGEVQEVRCEEVPISGEGAVGVGLGGKGGDDVVDCV